MNEKIFENDFVRIVAREKSISFYDKTDQYNDYRGFTQNVRGIEKVKEMIKNQIQTIHAEVEKITFEMIRDFLDSKKLNTHCYYGMD